MTKDQLIEAIKSADIVNDDMWWENLESQISNPYARGYLAASVSCFNESLGYNTEDFREEILEKVEYDIWKDASGTSSRHQENAAALLKKHLPAFGDWYSSYKNIDPPKSFDTLVAEYIEECNFAAPQPAGPVFTKATDKLPPDDNDYFLWINMGDVYMRGIGGYKAERGDFYNEVSGFYHPIDKVEWADLSDDDESAPALFTREQVEELKIENEGLREYIKGLQSNLAAYQSSEDARDDY